MARRSLDEVMRAPPPIDAARIRNTTEAEIRRHAVEDGEDPEAGTEGYLAVPQAQDLRRALAMTQDAFAAFLRVPVGTVRNWEQGRTVPDPAARTLLALVAADPSHALGILGGGRGESAARRRA